MKEWIGLARSLDRAVEKGLAVLGLARDRADVKVLENQTSSLLSMMDFRRVKVRVSEKRRRSVRDDRYDIEENEVPPRPSRDRARSERSKGQTPSHPSDKGAPARRPAAPPARHSEPQVSRRDKPQRLPASGGKKEKTSPTPSSGAGTPSRETPALPIDELMTEWRSLLGWDDLSWTASEDGGRTVVTLKSSHAAALAGNGGKPLEAWEYLFNQCRSVGRASGGNVLFRVEGFPSTEDSRGADKALRVAFQVRRTGQAVHLPPMPPGQRRAVHQALAHHPDVVTSSEGEGPARHVVVSPKGVQ